MRGSVRILVLGGSETAGGNCNDGVTWSKSCAWPARFAAWLREQFSTVDVRVDNQASGGSTISTALPSLSTWLSEPYDVVLIDFIVNGASLLAAACPPPLLTHRRFLGAAGIGRLTRGDLRGVRVAGASHPEGSCRRVVVTCALPICTRLRDIIAYVAAVHSVATVSFYDVASCAAHVNTPRGADGAELERMMLKYWDAGTGRPDPHPLWMTHQAITEMLAHATYANIGCAGTASSRSSIMLAAALAQYELCTKPAAMFSAFAPPASGVTLQGWQLIEDRPGKPGWITESPSSHIMFDVQFGTTPRLMVVWLKSYKDLGSVLMRLNGLEVTLPGLYDPSSGMQVSQNFLQTFQVQRNIFQGSWLEGGLLGFNITQHSRHTGASPGVWVCAC